MKIRLAFGRRGIDEGQEALTVDDLQEIDGDYMYSQNEPSSPAVIQKKLKRCMAL